LVTAYALIFGKFGLPHLGVRGLAYALTLQSFFYLVITSLILNFDMFFRPFKLFYYRVHADFSYIVKMFKVGWPIFLQMSGEILWNMIRSLMVGWIGINALAAYQVVIQYFFLILILIYAIAHASGILVGQACGRKHFNQISRIGNASLGLAILIGITIIVIFLFFPKYLATLFLDVHNPANTETVKLIVLLFPVFAFILFFDAIRNILTGLLRGLFDTKIPMLVGLFAIWLIDLPLSYLLAFRFHLGVLGIALGATIGMFIGASLLLYRWYRFEKNCHTLGSFGPNAR